MTKKEIADYLELEVRTLYNWEKSRPKLYNFIIENISNINENNSKTDKKENKIIELLEKLNEKEKEYYIFDIKARVLKKELEG
ncbi:cobalt chelatase [Campylobacter blaseri]|uniref:Cobalt chelatase n=1 Tax=Campylobacter blaseri TaxID=2042961 RepID=A0A2P8R2U3_9BACT|nr:cobalt chelatase [Campylobacter blaseri]PSM52788.1 cobalt chelatase [Campylobacter blaseri]PSM54436.1 cobalt chelatase [Campylobacter blaseri]